MKVRFDFNPDLDNQTKSRELSRDEVYATGVVKPKTTALFFDGIWLPNRIRNVIFQDENEAMKTKLEVLNKICIPDMRCDWYYEISGVQNYEYTMNFTRFREKNDLETFVKHFEEKDNYNWLMQNINYEGVDVYFNHNKNRALQHISFVYLQNGFSLTPVYLKTTTYDNILFKSEYNVTSIQACINYVPEIVEEELSWKQVIDFRKDKASITKLRRFRNWFNVDLLNKSENEIINILEKQLDDYKWSLKKHGIKTIISGFSSIVASTITTVELLSETSISPLLTGVTVSAGLLAWAASRVTDYIDIKKGPIAFIYDVIKL